MPSAIADKTFQEIAVLYEEVQHGIAEVRQGVAGVMARAEERWESYLRALALQTAEYDRRLDHLNGEQARVKEERQVLLSQLRREIETQSATSAKEIADLKESLLREIGLVRESLVAFTAEQRGTNKGIGLVWASFIAVFTLCLGLASLWFMR